jgi:uncharacterized membrane protein
MFNKIGVLLISTSAIFGASLFSSSDSALAWFQICNKSGSKANVAFAYLDIPDSREYCDALTGCEPLHPNQTVWNSEGWWNLSSGECAQVYPHELTKRNSIYYVYGETTDNTRKWSGEQPFCTLRTKFTLALADKKCNGQGREWKRFIKIDTGNSRNLTYSLTD